MNHVTTDWTTGLAVTGVQGFRDIGIVPFGWGHRNESSILSKHYTLQPLQISRKMIVKCGRTQQSIEERRTHKCMIH
jgi:hypothetical protein